MRSPRVAFGAALLLAAPGLAEEPQPAAVRGARVYQSACATCHGVGGDGKGPSARRLDPKPRDFTRGIFKFRSTPSGRPPTTGDLIRTIRNGIPRTTMPAWETMLGEQEIGDVARYVETFAPQKFQKTREPIEIPAPPEATPAVITEGKSLYVMLNCWSCHGRDGRGDGKAANQLTDDWGQRIRPFDFTAGRMKSGDTDRDVYRTIATGLDGTPMPAYGQAVLVRGVSERMLERYGQVYDEREIDALRAYLGTQPDRAAFETMSEAEKTALAARRIWSVVHYVRSLGREKGFFERLFAEDTEVTR